MKVTDRPKWKRIIVAVICLIGVLAIAGGSYAAYTSQAFQRGVARNRDTETIRFTSNYLQSCMYNENGDSKSYEGRTVLFSEKEKKEGTKLTFDLYIYNYANGNINLVSQKDITYKLIVTFSGGSGTAQDYNVKETETGSSLKQETTSESNAITYTIDKKTLTGRAANFHQYTIEFPGIDLDKLKITAVAIPDNPSVTNNQMLAAVIAPCTGSETQQFSKEGKFTDTSALPEKYDGFNYEISISSGKSEDATVKWDTSLVEIDKFFLVNLGKNEEEIKKILKDGSLTLTMDVSEGTGDYLIPFYIKDKEHIPNRWESTMEEDKKKELGMDKVITFTATQVKQ